MNILHTYTTLDGKATRGPGCTVPIYKKRRNDNFKHTHTQRANRDMEYKHQTVENRE